MSRWNRQVRNMAVLLAVAMLAAPFGAYHPTAFAAGDPNSVESDNTSNQNTSSETASEVEPEESPIPNENSNPVPEDNLIPEEKPVSGEIPVPEEEVIVEKGSAFEVETASEGKAEPEEEIILIEEEAPEQVTDFTLPDADLLYEEYFNRAMYPSVSQRKLFSARSDRLSVHEQSLLRLLKEQVVRIASGERDNATIEIRLSDVFGKLTFTFEELGITDQSLVSDTVMALLDATARRAVMSALMMDVPYELYWFDKTAGYAHAKSSYGIQKNMTDQTVTITGDPYIRYSMRVSAAYSKSGTANTTDVDMSRTGATGNAAKNAQRIVDTAATLASDYEKVCFYKDEICRLTEYNHSALDPSVSYGNPWQMVWVFDEDPTTNVVCEGYAKAFKYLCDKTAFSNPGVEAYLATGEMAATSVFSESNHMWNIVRMDDGAYYHADITNCDGPVPDDHLFLKGYQARVDTTGKAPAGFRYMVHGTSPRYFLYDSNMFSQFADEELEMSPADYGKSKRVTVTFDTSGGGHLNPAMPPEKEVLYQALYGTLPVPIPDESTYNVFLGWFTDPSAGERVTDDTLVTGTSDHTLYAHWKKDEKMERAAAIADLRGGYAALDRGGLWIYGIQEETEGAHKDYYYTGAPVKLTFTVYYRDMELTEGRDYTVSYRNNVKAANHFDKSNPAVIVKGKGNYAGTITHPYSILPADIGKPEITAPFDGIKDKNGNQTPNITITYNGKVQKPAVRLVSMLSGKAVTLKAGTDYTVSYDTARKVNQDGTDVDPPVSGQIRSPGYYELTVQGKGNFTGTRTILVEVVVTNAAIASLTGEALRTPVSALSIPNIPAQTYAGGASFVYLPQERISELKSGETLLRTANKAADFAWKIYDKTKKRELEYEKDYYLTYSANSAVGTASVVITGVGDYAGSVTKTFQINGTPVSKQTVTGLEESYVYTGEPIEPPVQLAGLTEGIDYTVSYSNHTAAGTASVIFTGINGYTGTLKRNYKITAYHIANDPENRVRARLAQSMLVYRKGGVQATPIVTYRLPGSGRLVTLKAGQDYTLKYANNTVANGNKTPTVMITGRGSFTGTIAPIPFDIIPADIGLYTQVTASDVVFRQKANVCKPVVTLRDKKTGANLAAGADYEKIFAYTYDRNVTVGRVNGPDVDRVQGEAVDPGDIIPANTPIAVTITGKNNYTGTVCGTFNFVAASISGATLLIGNQTYSGKAVRITEQKQFSKAQIKIGGIWHTLELGTHIEVVPGSYVNNIASGTARVTLRGIPANGFGGTKTVSFRIVKKSMDYTIRYNNNLEYLKNLYGLTDEEAVKRFRVTGTMADSVTTEGGRLRKNTFKIYDTEYRSNLKFLGWVVNENGKQAVYKDSEAFNHARMDSYRKYYGNTYTLYAQWEVVDMTDAKYKEASAYLAGRPLPWDKIVCYGDSVTQWGYPYHIEKQMNGITAVNKGAAGVTVHNDYQESGRDQRLKSIVESTTAEEVAGTDAVFVMAGMIDWLSSDPAFVKRPIGNASTPETFSHDFDQICKAIRAKFPGKPVFIVMPPNVNGTGNRYLDDYRNAEKLIAQANGCTVVDDHIQPGVFTVSNDAVRKRYYSNTIHLSNEGNDALAAMIMAEALRSMP